MADRTAGINTPRGRGNYRGGRGGGRGGQQRGGGELSGARGGERPKKENILDLTKYKDKRIVVKFAGGRQVTGILKGHDALMNLVLDEVDEVMQDEEGNERTRNLGLVVARGTILAAISPLDGSEEIPNPYVQAEV